MKAAVFKDKKNAKSDTLIKKQKKIKAIVCFTVLLVALGFLFKPVFFKRPLFIFGYGACIVSSQSMSPLYPVNSMVILKKVSPLSIKSGDVVAFKADTLGGKLAMHRVIQVNQNGFVTKGDQNPKADNQLVSDSAFVAKCIVKKGLNLHFLGRLLTFKGLAIYSFCTLLIVYILIAAKNVFKSLTP